MAESNMKKLTGLWKKEGRKGKYLSATAKEEMIIPKGYTIFVFPVTDKKSDKHPDAELVVAPPRERE